MILDTIGGLAARGRKRRQGAAASGNPVVEEVFNAYAYRGQDPNSSTTSQVTKAIVNNIELVDAEDEWTAQSYFNNKSSPYTGDDYVKYVVPKGVTSISAVGVGGGGGFITDGASLAIAAGSGGSLRYKNNISVTEGDVFTVRFYRSNQYRGVSVELRDSANNVLLGARGGNLPYYDGSVYDIVNVGDGGGNGGIGGSYTISVNGAGMGGGGAGGYTGNGGNGGTSGGGAGSGGGGGGGDGYTNVPSTSMSGGNGGNVYLYGIGDSGAGGVDGDGSTTAPGSGFAGSQNNVSDGRGGFGQFGGGRGARNASGYGGNDGSGAGGQAGIRIIGNLGGITRSFPNTNCGSNSDTTDPIGKGGMIWVKNRTRNSGAFYNPIIFDSERGTPFTRAIYTASNAGEATYPQPGNNFTGPFQKINSNGFVFGAFGDVNRDDEDGQVWTFRKQPRFFDIITWTGDGSSSRILDHNLGSTPGFVAVKRRSGGTQNWMCAIRDTATQNIWATLGTNAFGWDSQAVPVDQIGAPGYDKWTDTTIDLLGTVTNSATATLNGFNINGSDYVAYLFAHNDGDGGFGPNGDQDIIKCGTYVGNGSTGQEIDLGFEPQWIMTKAISGASDDWQVADSATGLHWKYGNKSTYIGTTGDQGLRYNFSPTPNGFQFDEQTVFENDVGRRYMYIAIRKGPMSVPTDPTTVFAMDFKTDYATTEWEKSYYAGFPVDLSIERRDRTDPFMAWLAYDRQSEKVAWMAENFDSSKQENSLPQQDNAGTYFDSSEGVYRSGQTSEQDIAYMWKRAPGFFDRVFYTATFPGPITVNHNLGVVPEMMIHKSYTTTGSWWVYHKDLNVDGDGRPETDYLLIDNNAAADDVVWADTAPTATQFTLGNVSSGTQDYTAWLFASCPGVSKVGSYTGTGASQTIDCGFTSGVRFLLIKNIDSLSNWWVYDTLRGITVAGDPYLILDSNAQENNGSGLGVNFAPNYINPHPSGFTLVDTTANTNGIGVKYIFYAVA